MVFLAGSSVPDLLSRFLLLRTCTVPPLLSPANSARRYRSEFQSHTVVTIVYSVCCIRERTKRQRAAAILGTVRQRNLGWWGNLERKEQWAYQKTVYQWQSISLSESANYQLKLKKVFSSLLVASNAIYHLPDRGIHLRRWDWTKLYQELCGLQAWCCRDCLLFRCLV